MPHEQCSILSQRFLTILYPDGSYSHIEVQSSRSLSLLCWIYEMGIGSVASPTHVLVPLALIDYSPVVKYFNLPFTLFFLVSCNMTPVLPSC